MDLICKFYIATLKEFFSVNSGTVTMPDEIDDIDSNENTLRLFQRKLIYAIHGSRNDN